MSVTVEIKLSKADRVYHAGEKLAGTVVITSKNGSLQHQGIRLQAQGCVQMRPSEKAVGMFESLFSNIKPIPLLSEGFDIAPAGKLPEGKSELAFALPLRTAGPETLPFYETYHGVNINIQYGVSVEVQRTVLRGGAVNTGLMEFVIEEQKPAPGIVPAPVPFNFSVCKENPDVITNCKPKLADFSLTGRLDAQVFQIAKPITGSLKIEKCKAKVASIDVQLVRNEEVKIDGTAANDLTEVQSVQLVDGDIGPDLEIPIFVILPRLYTCPSLTTKDFSVNFELNIVVAFQDEHRTTKTDQSEMAAIKFPIRLMR